jgi:membrane-associated phospholipid phosphatase
MLFATKKLSLGGHWINITKICCIKSSATLVKSAAAYLYTAIALYDGFIACWYVKYRDNLIRPETFINANIDAHWKPLLQTLPFPEYPSGHSVISTAAAIILTGFFGENFSFADDTEVPYGLPVRHFKSFMAAANEAAISRFYGGIHFKDAIVNGQKLGKEIGDYIVKKFRLVLIYNKCLCSRIYK